MRFDSITTVLQQRFLFLVGSDEQDQQSCPCRGCYFRRRALPYSQRGVIQCAFHPGAGVGRREERGKKDASFPELGAAGQECMSKFKPSECCARSREFGVPLSRSLQSVRELPSGICGIHVIYLMHEDWFQLCLLYGLRQKYFWFPTWCRAHQATAVLCKPSSNGSSGQLLSWVRLRQVGAQGEERCCCVWPCSPSLGREDLVPFAFLPRLNH